MSSDPDRIPCPTCGQMIVATARVCRFCGEKSGMAAPAAKEEGDSTGGVIPYKNVPALAAYYLGVFSFIPLCFPLGIAALIFGIIGLKRAKANPKVHGQVHAWIGIIVGGGFGLLYLGLTIFFAIVAIMEANH